jgi:hypothetical protein
VIVDGHIAVHLPVHNGVSSCEAEPICRTIRVFHMRSSHSLPIKDLSVLSSVIPQDVSTDGAQFEDDAEI